MIYALYYRQIWAIAFWVMALVLLFIWRLWKRPVPTGWKDLKVPDGKFVGGQPRRVFVHHRNKSRNEAMRQLFVERAKDQSARRRISKVLKGRKELLNRWSSYWGLGGGQSVHERYSLAKGFEVRCLGYVRVGGLALTRGRNDSPKDRQIIVGIEHPLAVLGAYTRSLIGHELVHCAQQAHRDALTLEWQGASVGDCLAVEIEAYIHFPLCVLLPAGPLAMLALATYLIFCHV